MSNAKVQIQSDQAKVNAKGQNIKGYFGNFTLVEIFRFYITRLDLVDGLPKFKYGKDHLCSACERGKSKKASHPPKLVPSDHSKLELLHMDLCGPMRVASINGKRIRCDAENIVVWNKTHLVAKGYKQEEGIDFEDSVLLFPLCLEAVRDVYRLKKALYGLKQAPRAWYDKLSSFLIEHGFTKDFSKRFANLMKNNFEMSMMGELKFFLGLQVHQSPRGIFISQSQYAIELLKKHGQDECVSMSTPMATERLDADLQGTPTDQTTYPRMIGGLMYLTASRSNIAIATFVCARYQARSTVKHLKGVKWIFRYLRQSYNMGLWYPKDSGFELIAYSDVDHTGCKDDCKSTSGGLQFLQGKHVSWSSKKQDCTAMSTAEAEYVSLTEYQLADLFTKALPKERFEYLVHRIVIIMAQQQHAADVHPDELCPPNKRYDLMDANKKVDLEHVQCPPESKILTNIIKNHPLRFSIAASSSVPWIYMAQFWHTLKEDRSKYRLRFMLDKKELTLTLDDFRQIFHLPQATANNHNAFVPPPSFSDMVPFYKQVLGFTMELKTQSNFKTTGLLQPWQTLCKIFSKCLTTRVTGWDQPPLQIMQMLYCFVNNIHVDYAELLWEGLYYSLHHPTSSIPYPRFTKIIVNHYMTIFPDISRRARDMYHNLQDDDIMKNMFNSGRHKNKVGMQIPAWMITNEMKQTEHYQMYAEVFGIDVPLTQSQPTESTHRTHRTTSAPSKKVMKPSIPEQSSESGPVMFARMVDSGRGKRLKKSRKIDSLTILQERWRKFRTQISTQIENAIANVIPTQLVQSVHQQYQLYLAMKVDPQFATTRHSNMDEPHDDAHPEGENSAKRQKRPRSMKLMYLESHRSGQDLQEELAPSTSGNQEQDDDFDFWTDSYASDDDEIPMKQVSQDIMEEVSLTIDEAKLRKMADEMLRQRCTSGDEHQYHIDQMKNFLKSGIVWESRKEIIESLHIHKDTPLTS
ncbi:uncharacterized mitochondrial protein-like protein [Tanacetum coccineum]